MKPSILPFIIFWAVLVTWVVAVVALWIWLWWLTRTWELSIRRAALRSLAVAIALTPTLVGGPLIAFPAPASLTVIAGTCLLLFSTVDKPLDLQAQVVIALIALLLFWLIVFAVTCFRHHLRQRSIARVHALNQQLLHQNRNG